MPRLEEMLENDTHLKPLLYYYIKTYDTSLPSFKKFDSQTWEYINTPEGCVASFRIDVIARGRAGSYNICDGYFKTLAYGIKKGEIPPTIKIISIINHFQSHWTSSVAEITVDHDFFKEIQK